MKTKSKISKLARIIAFAVLGCITISSASAQNGGVILPPQTGLSLSNMYGDRISLVGNRLGQDDMYGFGVRDHTLYHKSTGLYAWLTNTNVSISDDQYDIFKKSDMHLAHDANGTALTVRNDSVAVFRMLENVNSSINNKYGMFIKYDGKVNKTFIGGYNGASTNNAITILRSTGAVGIGTTTPSSTYKLSVSGKIRAKEIVVETGWADFVFEEGYDLKSLDEVETFIEDNGHLPDVPSAKQIENNGVSVGEMEAVLLQKVEELTLYMIEMKKQNELLQAELNQLK